MVLINPTIYRICASTCGTMAVLPLDLLQTQFIAKQRPSIKLEELKFIFYNICIFTIQNSMYTLSGYKTNSQIIRGICAGISATPVFYIMETRKMISRINMLPQAKKLLFWLLMREIVAYTVLYNIIVLDIPHATFVGSFFSNLFGFPLKFIAHKKAYPILNISFSSIKKTALVDILKNSLNDAITLYLIYSFPGNR